MLELYLNAGGFSTGKEIVLEAESVHGLGQSWTEVMLFETKGRLPLVQDFAQITTTDSSNLLEVGGTAAEDMILANEIYAENKAMESQEQLPDGRQSGYVMSKKDIFSDSKHTDLIFEFDGEGTNSSSSTLGVNHVALSVRMLGLEHVALDREQTIMALWKCAPGGKKCVDAIMQFQGCVHSTVNLLNSKSNAACEAVSDVNLLNYGNDVLRCCQWRNELLVAANALQWQSILVALKGCSTLLCCLDNPDCYTDLIVDLEVRGAIYVVEACAQTDTIHKIVFTSSLTAAIWRDNICSQKDVDERCWSDQDFCREMKLWYDLAKTLPEQPAWAFAMARMLNMVSVNNRVVLGLGIAQQNPRSTVSYLKGAAQLFENGVLVVIDVRFLADVPIRAFEGSLMTGRYFCFNQTIKTEEEAVKLAQSLSPLFSLPLKYKCPGSEIISGYTKASS